MHTFCTLTGNPPQEDRENIAENPPVFILHGYPGKLHGSRAGSKVAGSNPVSRSNLLKAAWPRGKATACKAVTLLTPLRSL